MVIAMTGDDSAMINGRILANFADGDVIDLRFPNDVAQVKTGKNGNSLYALNASGKQAEATIRIVRGSPDDKWLNNLFAQQQNNFAGFVLMTGEFVKKIGDGKGNITLDTYIMSGGIFTKSIDGKNNVEGDTAQSIAIYTVKFANSPRVIT